MMKKTCILFTLAALIQIVCGGSQDTCSCPTEPQNAISLDIGS